MVGPFQITAEPVASFTIRQTLERLQHHHRREHPGRDRMYKSAKMVITGQSVPLVSKKPVHAHESIPEHLPRIHPN